MQFDYKLVLILMSLSAGVVIILLKFVYRHDPHHNEQYGKKIILFNRTDRYKKRFWGFNLIEGLLNLKIKGKITEFYFRIFSNFNFIIHYIK